MRRKLLLGLVCIGMLGLVPQAGTAAPTPSFIRVIETKTWSIPAPDPMGLAYDADRGVLLVVDSEVEESVTVSGTTYPPAYWQGANFFEVTRLGVLTRTVNISKKNLDLTPNPIGYTDEPADVAVGVMNNLRYYFIVDDDADLVHVVALGANNQLDPDDVRTPFSTRDMTGDPEGLEFAILSGIPTLFIVAGEGPDPNNNQSRMHEIYRLQPGPNGVFDGPPGPNNPSGDDVLFSFDTCNPVDPSNQSSPCSSNINQHDPEDVAYDPVSKNLFLTSRDGPNTGGNTIISEITVNGVFVDSYNLGKIKTLRPSGLVVAESSGGDPNSRSFYIADRAVDNNSNRLANDGRIFEYQIGGLVRRPPTVTNPGPQSSIEGQSISLQISAVDPDAGDTITFEATNLPTGLSINATTGRITGTIATGAAMGSPYVTEVVVTDNSPARLATAVVFTWTVRDITPPAAPGPVTATRHTTGIHLDWPDNGEVDLAGYDVFRASSPTATNYTKLNTARLTASEFFDATAPPNAWSYYRVFAADFSNNISAPGTASARRSKIVFVGSSKAQGSGTALAIAKPAGIAAGDVMMAGILVEGSLAVIPPQGWTLVSQLVRSVALGYQLVYSRTATANEPATYTWTLAGRATAAGLLTAYRGAVERPTRAAAQANGESTEIVAPALVSTVNDAVQFGFFGIHADATIAPPAGMMIRADQIVQLGPIGLAIIFADVIVDAVSIPARVATASKAAANAGQVAVLSQTS